MNKVFENNINNIKDDNLRQELINYSYEFMLVLQMINGYNLSYKDTFLHNLENPIGEAVSIFQKSDNKENVIYIIYGIGLGYLFQVAVKEAKGQIILYEPNMDILHNALSLVDFSNELTKPNVNIFNDLDKLRDYISSVTTNDTDVQILSLPSYRELFKEKFENDLEKIQLTYGSNIIDYSFKKRRLPRITRNVLRNIPLLIEEIPLNEFENIYQGQTAIIVSAGPTLHENIDILKKYQENAIIFTVGTALKTLVKNNIKTDFLCMVEAFNNSKQVIDLDLTDINLIVEPFTNINVHKLNAKNKFLHFSENMPPSKFFADMAGIPTEGYLTQGTVSFLALNSAVKMGFKKIILVGQDLAYIDGQCYAKDSAYDGLICQFNEETQKYEIVAKDIEKFADILSNAKEQGKRIKTAENRLKSLNESLFTVKGINGQQIPTEAGYASFINHYADYAKEVGVNDGVIEFINTSMKGAQIDGYKNITLEDAMKDSSKIERKELLSNYKYNIEDIKAGLNQLIRNFKEYEQITNDIGKIASRLVTELKRNKTVDKEKLLKIRKMLEIYYQINEIKKENEIFRYVSASDEIELNDFIKTVQQYDEITLSNAANSMKKYYDSVRETIKECLEIIEETIEGINV